MTIRLWNARLSNRWYVVPAMILVLILGACAVPTKPAAQQAPPVQQVTLTGTEFSFSPNTINLQVGQRVDLTIKNAGALDHDLKSAIPISGLTYTAADNAKDEQATNIANGTFDVDYGTGTTAQVSFVPSQAGTYDFFCDLPDHQAAGMMGTFVVK
jgi:uncharacterized cupredoxin-like copper-binding protein